MLKKYCILLLKHNNAEEIIRKLKKLNSKGDETLSKERYYTLISESEKPVADIRPQIETLKREVDSQLKQFDNSMVNLRKKILLKTKLLKWNNYMLKK